MSIPRIGLAMIVKDEESNIRRALESARPFISTWVIIDTGSTDRTMDVILETYKDIPGVLVERPWVNFGHNRTELLDLCRDHMEWALMLDADDTVEGYIPLYYFEVPESDGLTVKIYHGDYKNHRIQIFRLSSDWKYNGVLHESPVLRNGNYAKVIEVPDTFRMYTRCEGVRSRDPQKYYNDALLLKEEYEKNPSNTRNLFYLANSYRDASMKEEAIHHYNLYVEHPNGWVQEKFSSLSALFSYSNDLNEKKRIVWKALSILPHRCDIIHGILEHTRIHQLSVTPELYHMALSVKNRKLGFLDLFVLAAVVDWAMDFEVCLVAYRFKDYSNAIHYAARSSVKAPDYIQQILKRVIKESTAALIEEGK
jgi:glycosyltransferase involved in cell wall biosynthesis